MPTKASRSSARGAPRSVRIIGGSLRGSKLPVLDAPGLRPSPDRLRETLYNWLGPGVAGMRVLDLFSGTGALGIEAASRGAAAVWLVERERRLAASLAEQLRRLRLDSTQSTTEVRLVERDALELLEGGTDKPFDLVLIDPPFAASLWDATLQALFKGGWLDSTSLIYLESPAQGAPAAPPGWSVRRQSRVGEVLGQLCERHPDRAEFQ